MKDKDIKHQIDRIIILIDSREHLPNHITKAFDEYGVKWERKKLKSGDYSAYLPKDDNLGIEEINLENELVIERKMSLDELANNISNQRERFKREFSRTEAKIILLIENNTYMDIINHNYNSKLTQNQFLGLLHSFCDTFKSPFVFRQKEETPLFIYDIFKYRIRNKLKNK